MPLDTKCEQPTAFDYDRSAPFKCDQRAPFRCGQPAVSKFVVVTTIEYAAAHELVVAMLAATSSPAVCIVATIRIPTAVQPSKCYSSSVNLNLRHAAPQQLTQSASALQQEQFARCNSVSQQTVLPSAASTVGLCTASSLPQIVIHTTSQHLQRFDLHHASTDTSHNATSKFHKSTALVSTTIHRSVAEAAFHQATASHACDTAVPAGTSIMHAHSQSDPLDLAFDNQNTAQ